MPPKSDLSEADICTHCITPAIEQAGWHLRSQVRQEVTLTDGRNTIRGNLAFRGPKKRADYVLYHKPNIPVAVIEAKDNNYSIGADTQQVQGYPEQVTPKSNVVTPPNRSDTLERS